MSKWHPDPGSRPPIERGIPIPDLDKRQTPPQGLGASASHRWEEMGLDDSFRAMPQFSLNAVRSAAWSEGWRQRKTFSVRQMPDHVRVWRVK